MAMNSQLIERFKASLGSARRARTLNSEQQAAQDICLALDSNRFNFGLEPVHNLSNGTSQSTSSSQSKIDTRSPMEYLLRPAGPDGKSLELGPGLTTLRQMGMSGQLDMVIIPRAIEQALSYGDAGLPVSVNIAPESMADSAFLTEMGTYLAGLSHRLTSPSEVVLEIPFNGRTSQEALAWMRQVQEMGFRIAIDNFGRYNPLEFQSVGSVKPAFVKLEGGLIKRALDGDTGSPTELRSIVEQVRRLSPESRLIAPWVTSVSQAKRLHDVYTIDAVQGRDLPRDRTYFSSQWNLLMYSQNGPSQH